MLEIIALKLHETTVVNIDGHEWTSRPRHKRVPILDAIREYAGVDIEGMNESTARNLRETAYRDKPSMGEGKLIDAIFGNIAKSISSNRLRNRLSGGDVSPHEAPPRQPGSHRTF